MILKVKVPTGDSAFRAGYVAAWHKQEGEPVDFGDDLCDVAIDEFISLQRTKRAVLLGSASKLRRRRIRDAYDLREGRGVVHIRLTSSEGGVNLGKIFVEAGGRVDVGQVIAVLSDEPAPSVPEVTDLDGVADARVVANMPDAAEIDPFD